MFTRYFTFCANRVQERQDGSHSYGNGMPYGSYQLNEIESDSSSYHMRRWENAVRGKGGHIYGLLVDQTSVEDLYYIAQTPLVQKLFGYPVYGVLAPGKEGNRMVVSGYPGYLPRIVGADPGTHIHIAAKDCVVTVSAVDLLDRCNRPEKLTLDCEKCNLINKGDESSCVEHCLNLWLEHNGHDPKLFAPKEGMSHDGWESEDFDDFLKNVEMGDFEGYSYIPPCKTQSCGVKIPRNVAPLFRPAESCYLSKVDENKEARSERSRRAAATRKHTKVCHAECCLKDQCDWLEKRYIRASFCQTGNSANEYGRTGHSRAHLGPYTDEKIMESYNHWWNAMEKGSVDIEKISYMAYHAGNITNAFGFELRLGGMDSHMNHVQFFREQRPWEDMFYTYDDAVKLMKTPFRQDGGYHKMFADPPPRLMTRDELIVYAEARRHKSTLETYGFGNRAFATHVRWNPHSSNFAIHVNGGYYYSGQRTLEAGVEGIKSLAAIFGVGNTIRDVAAPGPTTTTEVAEVLRYSSPDIRP